MTHNARHPHKHHQISYRWIIDFTLRIANDNQRRVVNQLGERLVHDVVQLWLEIIMPESIVVGPVGGTIRQVQFSRRSDMRRFQSIWGGRIVARSPSH